MSVNAFIESVERDVLARHLLRRGQPFVVAVSGGVDSMVLLDVLCALSPRHGWKLTVAHFNHGLRGRSSEADERFVRAAARRLNLPWVSSKGAVRELAGREGLSIEMAARRLRHEFVARSARELGAKAVALGHHADDQVEWFFVKLLRGSGGPAMQWANPSFANPAVKLIRPLLGRTREEICDYARSGKVKFREDATNASTEMLRNKVRHELIPLLENSYQPALRKVVLRELEIGGAEADLARQLAAAWRRQGRGGFNELPVAVQRRVLQSALAEQGLPVMFECIEALRRNPGRPVNITGGQLVHDGAGRLERIAAAAPAAGFGDAAEFEIELQGRGGKGCCSGLNWRWSFGRRPAGQPLRFRAGVEWFDAAALGARVRLRRWRPGDRFQPSGLSGAVKLQDLFTNLKVPRAERHQRVVALTDAGDIWWVEGLRIGERFKVRPDTRRVMRWTWSRE